MRGDAIGQYHSHDPLTNDLFNMWDKLWYKFIRGYALAEWVGSPYLPKDGDNQRQKLEADIHRRHASNPPTQTVEKKTHKEKVFFFCLLLSHYIARLTLLLLLIIIDSKRRL